MSLPLTPGQTALWFSQCANPGSATLQCAELLTFEAPTTPAASAVGTTTSAGTTTATSEQSLCTTATGTTTTKSDTSVHSTVEPDILADVITDCLAQLPTMCAQIVDAHFVSTGHPVTVTIEHLAGTEETQNWVNTHLNVPAMCTDGVITQEELSGQHLALLPDGTCLWLARFHHILGDGFAFHILIQWIAHTYSARVAGVDAPACPFISPAQALDRAQSYLEGEHFQPDEQFWRTEHAAGRIPLDPPAFVAAGSRTLHSPSLTARTITAHAHITPETHSRLHQVATQCGVSDPDLYLGLIAHYTAAVAGEVPHDSSATSVSIGFPQMNRPLGVPGFALDPVVNVLPVHVDVTPGESAGDFLTRVAAQSAAVRAHGGYRQEYLRRACTIDPQRRITGPSVNFRPFPAVFQFGPARAHLTTQAVGPVTDTEIIIQSRVGGGLDLLVVAQRADDSDSAADTLVSPEPTDPSDPANSASSARPTTPTTPSTSTNSSTPQTPSDPVSVLASRLAAFFSRVGELITDATQSLDSVPLLTPTEYRQVTAGFNDTDRQLGPELTLPALIAHCRDSEAASPRAAAPGFFFGSASLTRKELWDQVWRLKTHLESLGAAPGKTVAVHLRRGPALAIAIAAVAASGAAFVPISPDLPENRKHTMLATASPSVLITGSDFAWTGRSGASVILSETDIRPASSLSVPPGATHVGDSAATALDAGAGATGGAEPREGAADNPATPDSLAYVLFTSGSTGVPKAVAIPQKAIVNRLCWMADYYHLDYRDTLLQKTPCSFDVSVWEFLLPFTHGVKQVVARDGAHLDPALLCAELAGQAGRSVTVCHFVPSALKAFLAGVEDFSGLSALRAVITSGEALDAQVARQCRSLLGVEVHNLYGPTEAAIDVTAHTYDGEAVVPIGAPVWNTSTYVLDWARRPLPVGSAGRLFLGGIQLADGYLGQPELTAERFIANPFALGRLYDTGDIAQWLPTGELLFHGRSDSQVKLRGQRLELGEVNAVVVNHPAVAQCATVLKTVAGQPTLVAYVVLKKECADVHVRAALHDYAAGLLPSYMVPSFFVLVSALPTTINGKLDHSALPDPVHHETAGSSDAEKPSRAIVADLQRCFAQVVKQPEFPLKANFFDYGGNSLSAVMLVNAIKELGLPATIADIFAAPTPEGLAARLAPAPGEKAAGHSPYAELLPLRTHHEGVPVFCLYPAGGLGWSYAGLLPFIAPGRGVYAVQAPGIEEPAKRVRTLQQAAESGASAISKCSACADEKTVDLVGWSVGGVIAHTVAGELERRGITVRRLCLLDAYPAEMWKGRDAPTEQERLAGLLTMTGAEHGGELTREGVFAAIRRSRSPFAALDGEILVALMDMIALNARLMREHTTPKWQGEVQFFKAERNPEHMDEGRWKPYVGDLRMHRLDMTHPELVSAAALQHVAAALD